MTLLLSELAAVFEGMLRCPERVAYDGNCELDFYEGPWKVQIFMDCGEPDYVAHVLYGEYKIDFGHPLVTALTNYLAAPEVRDLVLGHAKDCSNWDYDK